MSGQQIFFAELIRDIKKALMRPLDASDSDDSIHQPTNRGNKLKRKAKYVREGKLSVADPPCAYRRKIEHAGYPRYVISERPPRVDADGDVIEQEDDWDEADDVAYEDPYGGIKLEQILAPLTSAADLPTHPSMSIPYFSNVLPDMVRNAREMVHRENASHWRMKQFLTNFRGDETWIPCELLQTNDDMALFERQTTLQDGQLQNRSQAPGLSQLVGQDSWFEARTSIEGKGLNKAVLTNEDDIKDGQQSSGVFRGDRMFSDREKVNHGDDAIETAHLEQSVATEAPIVREPEAVQDADGSAATGEGLAPDSIECENNDLLSDMSRARNGPGPWANRECLPEPALRHSETRVDGHGDIAVAMDQPFHGGNGHDLRTVLSNVKQTEERRSASHRMTTRAQAQAFEASIPERTRSVSPMSSEPSFVHPFFLPPPAALPDPDYGLPPREADDVRKLLTMYVQKQEEVVRGAQALSEGLMRADRMRNNVLRWTKAEGHLGEMSDGEDWYDKEEWGLDDDLKKGIEEDEEEANAPGKKSRRARVER